MKEMKKIILTILTTILFLTTLLIAWTFINRLTINYNEDGRHFDEESMTVYKQQSVWVYGLFTTIGIVLTTLTMLILKREKSKKL